MLVPDWLIRQILSQPNMEVTPSADCQLMPKEGDHMVQTTVHVHRACLRMFCITRLL